MARSPGPASLWVRLTPHTGVECTRTTGARRPGSPWVRLTPYTGVKCTHTLSGVPEPEGARARP